MSWLSLPGRLQDFRSLVRALDWHAMARDVAREAQARLVIIGPVNSGKSTLFNVLHGHTLSSVSAVPGTTKGVVEHPLGPFLLVDTPGFGEVWGIDRAETARDAVVRADVIVLLLDAAAGVRQSDHDLLASMRGFGVPVVVALNKIDLVKKDLPWILENAESLLDVRPIPISARTKAGIMDDLLPAIFEAQPSIATALARAMPAQRAGWVRRIIRRTSLTNALIALQPIPGLDIPLLLTAHIRMVLRIASAYGKSMDVSHARELLTAMAGSLLSRYLTIQVVKLVPGLGWVVSAFLSGLTTWGMGQAAQAYFEAGGQISSPDLERLYHRAVRTARRRWLRRKTKGTGETPDCEEPDRIESGGRNGLGARQRGGGGT
jgi:small GTP-binding protein